ncbi:MAG: transporter [Eubacterium sp.]|nr:transporter [Eubacterium sp.]
MKLKDVKNNFNKIATNVAAFIEAMAAVFIVVIAAAMLIKICISTISEGTLAHMSIDEFGGLLGELLIITVGIEFVKLLVRHRLEDVVDVVMLAVARQMVVEHHSMKIMLIGIVSIAILFAIRRFLFVDCENESFFGMFKRSKSDGSKEL